MTISDEESQSCYLNHLQSFNSESGKVVLTNDVKNEQGVLLAAKGERLSENHVSKMIQHKLLRSLEECVGLEPVFNAKLLRSRYDDIFEKYPDIAEVVKVAGADKALLACLLYVENIAIIMQKLTIMGHALEEMLDRSMLNAALSLSLAIYDGFDKKECVKYFVVSLIENIGYLHLNPHLADEILPAVEFWREFYVHPLVAKQMLSKVAGVPASIVRGVADSHERIDGTGFPRMAAKQEMTAIALHTGLIDELTRLRFSRGIKPSITIREAMAMLQFRRAHFCDHAFATLNGLILSADLAPSPIAKEEELVSFARLQLVYYTECLVYCDVVARIADSSSLESNSKSIERLHLMCKGFIKSVFASGMLSQPIWRLIEECANNKELELLQDMMEIDHAHHGILDRLHEIFLLLEYILEYEEQPDEIAQSAAFLSLNGCWAFFTHLKSERERSHIGWQSLIDKMYDGQNDLGAIMQSMKAS